MTLRAGLGLLFLLVSLLGLKPHFAVNQANADEDMAAVERDADRLHEQGRYFEALPIYQRLLAHWEGIDGLQAATTATALNDVAKVFHALGRYAEAADCYGRALAIEEALHGSSHPNVSSRLNNLADVYRLTGRYGDAEPRYRRALAINEALDSQSYDSAISLNNLAELFRATGRYQEAEPLYLKAAGIFEKAKGADSPQLAYALNNLGLLAKRLGRNAEAEKYFGRALIILEKAYGPKHPHVAIILNNQAFLLEAMDRTEEAEPVIRRALAVSEQVLGEEHPSVAINLKNLGKLLETTGRQAEAEVTYRRAWRVARNAGNPEITWKVQSHLMSFYRDAKPAAPALAIFFGKQAINTMQALRVSLKDSDAATQKAFLASLEENYRALATMLIDAGRLPEAQQVLAMLKEGEYYEFTRRNTATDTRTTRAGLTTTEVVATSRVEQAEGRLFAYGEEVRALEKKRQQAALAEAEQARLRELRQQLRAANEAFEAVVAELKLSFKSLQDDQARMDQEKRALEQSLIGAVGELGPGVALVQTVSLPEGLTLLLTTDKLRKSYRVPVTASELNLRTQALLATLYSPRLDPRPAAGKLYDVLLRPLADDLVAANIRTLMFSLDGVLRYVPMAVLHDGDGYLAEKMAISLFNEAARTSFAQQKPQAHWRVAGMGVSQARDGFSPLDAVPAELRGIVGQGKGGVLPGEIHLDDKFTLASLLDAVDDGYPVVHVASHFKFQPGNNTDSFLLLGDGKLTLADFSQKVSLPKVELLTLSACETAVGGGGRGTEVEGLAVTAQLKGAKAVLATLWPVADQSTGLFMQNFYRLREDRMLSKAEALRQSQLIFISGQAVGAAGEARGAARVERASASGFVTDKKAPYSHPFYWAPFVLMGNWL